MRDVEDEQEVMMQLSKMRLSEVYDDSVGEMREGDDDDDAIEVKLEEVNVKDGLSVCKVNN